jgi:hypothetical protein
MLLFWHEVDAIRFTLIGRMALEAIHLAQSKECNIILQHTVVIFFLVRIAAPSFRVAR